MMKAYYGGVRGKPLIDEDYKRTTTLTEDPERIKKLLMKCIEVRDYDLDIEDTIFISEIINNDDILNKAAIVSDLSYRNCTMIFRKKSVYYKSEDYSNEETMSKILAGEFEKLFIYISSYQVISDIVDNKGTAMDDVLDFDVVDVDDDFYRHDL